MGRRDTALQNLKKAWAKRGIKPGGHPPPLALQELEANQPEVHRTAAQFARLLQQDGVLPYRPAFDPALRLAASAYLRALWLDSYLKRHGMIRQDGTPRPAAELYFRALKEAREFLTICGLTPISLQKLGLETARTQADTALALAKLRAESVECARVVDAAPLEDGTGTGVDVENPSVSGPPEASRGGASDSSSPTRHQLPVDRTDNPSTGGGS